MPYFLCSTGVLAAACGGDGPAALTPGIDAKKAPPPPPPPADVPVTAIVADADPSVAPTLQIQSDGLGAYENSSTLTSEIQSDGTWLLDSYNPLNATRAAYLAFDQPLAGSGPGGGDPVGVPSGLYRVRIRGKCPEFGNTMQGLEPGATITCP
jgi:hypothetical protein